MANLLCQKFNAVMDATLNKTPITLAIIIPAMLTLRTNYILGPSRTWKSSIARHVGGFVLTSLSALYTFALLSDPYDMWGTWRLLKRTRG